MSINNAISMHKVSNSLDAVFKKRSYTTHACKDSIQIVTFETHKSVIVFDTNLSRQVLTSKAFAGFNYFKAGMQQLEDRGEPVQILKNFYDENILFNEGDDYPKIKKAFNHYLENFKVELDKLTPRVVRFFQKRQAIVTSPLIFSLLFTRLCTALLISHLTHIPLKRIYDALRMRRNVFDSYFNPLRQLAASNALQYLYADSAPPKKEKPEWMKHLLAQAMFTMGVDPIVASICANITNKHTSGFAENIDRFCPTSFVTRICIEQTQLMDIEFHPQDICYLSLVPADLQLEVSACPVNKPKQSPSLAFGVGKHTCIGKHFSSHLLRLAELVANTCFKNGFRDESYISADGSFLSFKD
jgi:hypothetical protein